MNEVAPAYLLHENMNGEENNPPVIQTPNGPVRVVIMSNAPSQPVVRANSHSFKDALLVILLMGVTGAAGYLGRAWEEYKTRQSISDGPASEGVLVLPNEIELAVNEPIEVRAETAGRRVIFQSLDPELVVRPFSAKSVWVFSSKPGKYNLQAWTAVNGLPTANAVTIVKVVDKSKKDEKASKDTARKD